MSYEYENAPQTEMVATNCACCSRPLVDSISVETGMGPVCREKHGYNIEVSEESRAVANRLVREIAIKQNGIEVLEKTTALKLIGFFKLAERIEKRLSPIKIEENGTRFSIKTPYNQELVNRFRSIFGREWDKENKVNTFPVTSKKAVWQALRDCFSGSYGVGPKGVFEIK